ncbi:unnamed protein product [Phytomonas sp. Hart1]|nr:unnamed protein product [Phytomonas sp. Hart1]|eukprot:CCW66672.1 unnamed protein product [Phytomonas sp. isolate Hart1]
MFPLTPFLRLRAVRTFMQLREAATPFSGETAITNPRALSERSTDVARACRIATSLLKHHFPQQDLPSLKGNAENSAKGNNENAAVDRVQKAHVWAEASGKAAYLTHVAHQRRFDASSSTDLVKMTNRTWASWDTRKKVKWVLAAPQGRRALRFLADTDPGRTPEKGLGSARGRPPRLGKKKNQSLLPPRSPSAAAVSCKPSKRRHLTRQEWDRSPPPHATEGPSAGKQGVFDAAATAGASLEPPHDLSVPRLRQRNRWKQKLNQMLGRNDSRTFQGTIKEHQQEYEDIPASAQPVQEASKASNTDIFLNFCDGMNIGSARKAYVLQKMIPFLDSNERDVDNNSVSPLSLAEVKATAQRFSQEFDQYRKDILKASGTTLAVQAYEKALIDEELAQVRCKLDRFQDKVPLLQRIANLCMGH